MPFRPPFLTASEQFIKNTSSHRTKLITCLIYQFVQNPAAVALDNLFKWPPMHQSMEIHQIYAVGGANSFTKVVMIVG
jgi:hypothetical protein